jgi:DNA-binding CsgD family transcriptional regulator
MKFNRDRRGLKPTQVRIVRAMLRGVTDVELLAAKFRITPQMVCVHLFNVFRIAKVKDAVSLIGWANEIPAYGGTGNDWEEKNQD